MHFDKTLKQFTDSNQPPALADIFLQGKLLAVFDINVPAL